MNELSATGAKPALRQSAAGCARPVRTGTTNTRSARSRRRRLTRTDGRAGLALRARSPGRSTPPRTASPDPWKDPANHIAFAAGTGAWTRYEVTAQIPADASLIRFGVFLNGSGQIELRNPQLETTPESGLRR